MNVLGFITVFTLLATVQSGTGPEDLVLVKKLTQVRTTNLSGNIELNSLEVLAGEQNFGGNSEITEELLWSNTGTKAPTDGFEPFALMNVFSRTSGTLPDQNPEQTIDNTGLHLISEDLLRHRIEDITPGEDIYSGDGDIFPGSFLELGANSRVRNGEIRDEFSGDEEIDLGAFLKIEGDGLSIQLEKKIKAFEELLRRRTARVNHKAFTLTPTSLTPNIAPGDVPHISLNNITCSIKIQIEDSIIFVPDTSTVTYLDNTITITWTSLNPGNNNTLLIKLGDSIHLGLVKNNRMHIFKSVPFSSANTHEDVDTTVVTFDEHLKVSFSNPEFLKLYSPETGAMPSVSRPVNGLFLGVIVGGVAFSLISAATIYYAVRKIKSKIEGFKPACAV